MPRPPPTRPTDAELAILRVLWDVGPATVRQVHERLNRGRPGKPAGYTTVLKFMQIMAERGLLRRDESQRSHVYHPVASEEKTQRRLVSDLLERVFGGSAQALVQQALAAKPASAEELAQIRKLLDSFESSPRNHQPGAPASGTSKGGSR
jgi:BlaI family transcriptional regulator, penicillinase repressor